MRWYGTAGYWKEPDEDAAYAAHSDRELLNLSPEEWQRQLAADKERVERRLREQAEIIKRRGLK